MKALAVVLAMAGAPSGGITVDCDAVRAAVAQHGKVAAFAWAMGKIAAREYSWKEFRAAKKCLEQKGKG